MEKKLVPYSSSTGVTVAHVAGGGGQVALVVTAPVGLTLLAALVARAWVSFWASSSSRPLSVEI